MTHTTLAMHMANELLSVPVAVATLVLAAAALVACSWWASRRLDAERFPLMGVIGAFIFAAQMINFPLPGLPGTSGHLGGGVLLAILLGPAGAVVTMAAILVIQCLVFQDGGLLALGCNVINMGIVPAVLGYGVYRLVLGRKGPAGASRQYVAAFAAAVAGVTAGAALVPIQAHISGVLAIPLRSFLAVMVGVHLVIGAVEGAITFAVVAFVRHVRPAALGADPAAAHQKLSRNALIASLLVTAALLGGVVSWFACGDPDGLEWSYQEHRYTAADAAIANDSSAVAGVEAWQARWAPMPDYGPEGWTSLAGLGGTVLTLVLVYAAARLLRKRRAIQPDDT